MPEAQVYPALPPELLLEIFSYLTFYDVQRIFNVNSYFRAVAQPFAYRRAFFTRFGLCFPGTLNPYPFFDSPDLSVTNQTEEDRNAIIQWIKRIDLRPHMSEECAAWDALQWAGKDALWDDELGIAREDNKLDVLNVRLSSCPIHWNSSPEDRPYSIHGAFVHEEQPRCYGACREGCRYIRPRPATLNVKKLVVRDTLCTSSSKRLPEFVPQEFVSVFNSRPLRRQSGGATLECEDDTMGFGFHILGRAGAELMTLILWTASPYDAWVPPSDHHMSFGFTGATPDHKEYDISVIWASLLKGLHEHHIFKLRIVNAIAIIPSHMDQEGHEFNLRHGAAAMDIIEPQAHFQTLARSHHNLRLSNMSIEFLSMEEWIEAEEWEDVFTPAEMAPWLERMRGELGMG